MWSCMRIPVIAITTTIIMVRTVLVEANAGKVERVIEEDARKSTNKNECKEMHPV